MLIRHCALVLLVLQVCQLVARCVHLIVWNLWIIADEGRVLFSVEAVVGRIHGIVIIRDVLLLIH